MSAEDDASPANLLHFVDAAWNRIQQALDRPRCRRKVNHRKYLARISGVFANSADSRHKGTSGGCDVSLAKLILGERQSSSSRRSHKAALKNHYKRRSVADVQGKSFAGSQLQTSEDEVTTSSRTDTQEVWSGSVEMSPVGRELQTLTVLPTQQGQSSLFVDRSWLQTSPSVHAQQVLGRSDSYRLHSNVMSRDVDAAQRSFYMYSPFYPPREPAGQCAHLNGIAPHDGCKFLDRDFSTTRRVSTDFTALLPRYLVNAPSHVVVPDVSFDRLPAAGIQSLQHTDLRYHYENVFTSPCSCQTFNDSAISSPAFHRDRHQQADCCSVWQSITDFLPSTQSHQPALSTQAFVGSVMQTSETMQCCSGPLLQWSLPHVSAQYRPIDELLPADTSTLSGFNDSGLGSSTCADQSLPRIDL